ncbi:NACHT and WD repeat domain-containing protein 2-like [Saccostrea echinata]|uniref:NACHT and WD repeat domain-containing protein 2-like n=1 Tax=Saccostrea echinata TaxID=191078 RepID=UPI002A8154BB|nr:NACHT and WD repeat domain-containing protein 2-like [Saccostrea echinata]
MSDKLKKSVLRGCLDHLPTLNSRVVRIFISSTFTDTREERNILIEEVYPRLQSYCKQNYGLEFQVVDMRWGVPEEASDDHSTSALCLAEVLNCQKLSTGPNFVTFLNQRHGYRALQTVITWEEFTQLMEALRTMGEDLSSFNIWYKEDTNSIPPVFVLQQISSIIPNYKIKDPEAMRNWERVAEEMRDKLQKASQHCFEEGKMTEEEKHKYFMSVTEEEIEQGILKSPGNPVDHCLCFVRIIEDIDKNLGHSKAWRYIDMTGSTINQEAQKLLNQLREDKLPKVVSKDKIQRSLVRWSDKEGINREDHKGYLTNFAEQFYGGIKSLLDKSVSMESELSKDNLYIEVLQHLTMAKERCAMFHGRQEILDKISSYLREGEKEPFTIYGPSGSGKTSIIAEAARRVPFEYHKEAVVILRFLGTSPDSSNLRRLLRSLCSQILYNVTGSAENVPEEFDELVILFQGLLEEYKSDRPLVILLDSLDQLTEDHAAYKLRWLPRKLKSNVRIVLSSYIETLEIVTNLKALFSPKSFIIVPVLGEDLGFQILKVWLEASNRTLTSEQFDIVHKAFQVCSLPLFVKLVFENILVWKSYTPPDKCVLQTTLQESISSLFGHLENKHGRMFVERSFAYLTASSSGLSELEFEDVMSIDDTLLTEVFKFQLPPVRRIPSLLWVRLKYDVQKYIVDKEVDETRVTFWYHRQFIEASQERYLKNAAFAAEIHSNLADYFLGKWYNVPKPFKYTAEQVKKYSLSSVDSAADRKIADQPIKFVYTDQGGRSQIRFNKRKLNKLPFHLAKADREIELNNICLYNYHFVIAKIKATSVIQVLSDFIYTKTNRSSVLEKVLKSCQSSLQKYPDSLAFEVCGHMLSYLTERRSSPEKTLVTECLKVSEEQKKPIPFMMCYNVPSEALLYKLENQKLPYGNTHVAVSTDGKHLVALAEKNLVFFWDLTIGELECELQAFNPDECKLNTMGFKSSDNVVYFSSTYQKSVHPFIIVNIQTSEIKKSLILGKNYPAVGMADSLKHALTNQRIFSLHKGHSADVFNSETGQHEHNFGISADDMLISPEEKLVAFHLKSTTTYVTYSVKNLDELHRLEVAGPPLSLCLSPTTNEAFVLLKDTGQVHMVNTNKDDGTVGQVLSEIKSPDGQKIQEAMMSSSGNFLILRTDEGFFSWNYKSNKLHKEFKIPNALKPEHRVLDMFGILLPDDKTFIVGYEGHLILWDVAKGRIKASIEASKSKLSYLIINNARSLAVTTSKRNNSVQVWNLNAMETTDSKFQPLTMKTSPRYIDVCKTGELAVVRGNSANDVSIVDLVNGRVKMNISEVYDIMRPVISPDGAHAVLREYDGDSVIKIWDTATGNLVCSLPLSSLLVKHFKCSNSRVLVKCQDKNDSTFSFWDIKTGENLYSFSMDYVNIGEIILEMTHSDDEILVSRNQKGEDVGACDLLLINVCSGEELFTLPGVNPSRIQPVGDSGYLFLTEQVEGQMQYLIILDTKTRKIVKKEKVTPMPQSFLSLDAAGHYGIDRGLNLYDLKTLKHIHQFDIEEKEVMQKNVKTKATAPKMMPNGQVAVWLNIRGGLLKVGSIKDKIVLSVFPVHSIPINLDVSAKGLIIVGCEDGRIMLLQLPDYAESKDRLTVFISEVSQRLIRLSKDVYSGMTKRSNKPQGQQNKKSSVCAIA